MSNSKNSVQARIKNLSKQLDVSVNVLLVTYFFDAFLLRLSKSVYLDNFIFKGGFYLSAIIGIQNRYTQDLDFKLTGIKLEEKILKEMLKEIISIPVGDCISFEFSAISAIRDEDQYGGYTVSLTGHLENIRQVISIDIATGDPVTPEAVTYEYKRLLEDDALHFKAYNIETILSEKLQTIYHRGLLNSRSKDYYDVYVIRKLKMQEINVLNLKSAFVRTCDYRNTQFSKDEVMELIKNILVNEQIAIRWNSYARKNSFARGLKFEDVIAACKEITEILFAAL